LAKRLANTRDPIGIDTVIFYVEAPMLIGHLVYVFIKCLPKFINKFTLFMIIPMLIQWLLRQKWNSNNFEGRPIPSYSQTCLYIYGYSYGLNIFIQLFIVFAKIDYSCVTQELNWLIWIELMEMLFLRKKYQRWEVHVFGNDFKQRNVSWTIQRNIIKSTRSGNLC